RYLCHLHLMDQSTLLVSLVTIEVLHSIVSLPSSFLPLRRVWREEREGVSCLLHGLQKGTVSDGSGMRMNRVDWKCLHSTLDGRMDEIHPVIHHSSVRGTDAADYGSHSRNGLSW
ncbi:hypothetical protein PMAYCL1PPCAC_06792, partial [Pristionchus mayeri]